MAFKYGFIVLAAFVLGLFALALPASAQSITCANVRCAGHCVDTPGGPVCEPQRATCASTLCAQGNHCVETQSGPQCIPAPSQPQTPWTPWPQPATPAPSPAPWTPWPQTPEKPTVCPEPMPTPNSRPKEPIACPMVYDPVCAQKIVQCVRAPCPPVRQTFSNSCVAKADGYTVLYQGTCG